MLAYSVANLNVVVLGTPSYLLVPPRNKCAFFNVHEVLPLLEDLLQLMVEPDRVLLQPLSPLPPIVAWGIVGDNLLLFETCLLHPLAKYLSEDPSIWKLPVE